jgi:peptidoglycan/LPS O-acetylase OafA/YrhL
MLNEPPIGNAACPQTPSNPDAAVLDGVPLDDGTPSPGKRAKPVVDMRAHNGLRGVLALWIMLFHCVFYSKLHELIDVDRPRINLMGSALMPSFFVLSGFSLAVCHGATLTPDGGLFTAEWWAGWRRFMQNRAARILPVFYLVTACAVPLTFLGHGWVNNDTFSIVSRVITNVLVIHMWTPVAGSFCGPAWTVSTLWFFYVIFPIALPRLQRVCSHPNRCKQIGGLTLWQLAPICKPCTCWLLEQTSNKHQLSSSTNRMQSLWRLLAHLYVAQWNLAIAYSLIGFAFWGIDGAFWCSHALFWSRMPVFVSGMAAGLYCVHSQQYCMEDQESGAPLEVPWIGYVIPVGSYPIQAKQSKGLDDEMAKWARIVDRSTATFLVPFFCCCVLSVVGIDVAFHWWSQFLYAHFWCTLLVALTRDGGTSKVAALLNTRVAQYLGAISMPLYLVHGVLIQYACVIITGAQRTYYYREHYIYQGDVTCHSVEHHVEASVAANDTTLRVEECQEHMRQFWSNRLMPPWAIPIVMIVSLILAVVLHHFVGEPLRKKLRAPESTSTVKASTGIIVN